MTAAVEDQLRQHVLAASRDDPSVFMRLASRGRYQRYRHQQFLFDRVRECAEQSGRLIVSVSVRHFKSTTCSAVFPAWWIGRNPSARIILGTSESGLASRFSGQARDMLREWGPSVFGVSVDPSSSSKREWHTLVDEQQYEGGMSAVGRGGSPEGRGGSIIVDDPYRSFADAMSPLVRRECKEWWLNTLAPRLNPGGFAIVLCARWHEEDLSGMLMREYGERWSEIRLPAICDSDSDPLGRKVGEALCPEWMTAEELAVRRLEVTSEEGEATWLARYQQSPLSFRSHRFPPDRWGWIGPGDPILKEVTSWVTAWDLAATDGGGDWTVGVTMGLLPDRRIVIREVIRGRWNVDERDRQIAACAARNGHDVPIVIPQDPGAAGKAEAVRLRRMLAGHVVRSAPVTGSKDVRSAGWQSCVQAGDVFIVRSAEAREFVAVHSQFAGGSSSVHDDDVDAAADAYKELTRNLHVEVPDSTAGWEYAKSL